MEQTVDTGRRAAGVGTSSDPDGVGAGETAVRAALDRLGDAGADPALLVVYASARYDPHALARGFSRAAGDVPLIGCTTAGEIATAGPGEDGVVAVALGGVGLSVAVGMGSTDGGDLRRAGAQAARCVDALPGSDRVDRASHRVLLLLSDGLSGDQQEVVRGAYEQVGAAVPLVGGCAGDDLRMDTTHQFFGSTVHTGAVLGAALECDGPMGIGVRHGWTPVGEQMTVTSAQGVVVRTLDDEPALDVYLDRLDAPPEVRVDPEAFTAHAATRPIGLVRRGREEIRFVATADFEQRTISCFAEVPQGGQCSIMRGDQQSVLDAVEEAMGDAIEPLGGAAPAAVMVFDCIARKGVLGGGVSEEVERIAAMAAGAPVAGFYTYGEIARVSGSGGFHNQTLVVLAIG